MDFLNKFGINIKDKELLLRALTHTSYAYENKTVSNERLEYLGDSILQLVVSEYLYIPLKCYPELSADVIKKYYTYFQQHIWCIHHQKYL